MVHQHLVDGTEQPLSVQVGGGTCYDDTNGLVLWYKFDDNANETYDSVSGTNKGTKGTHLDNDTHCKIETDKVNLKRGSGYIDFKGSSDNALIDNTNFSSITTSNNVTVSFWFNVQGTGTNADYGRGSLYT